MNISFDDVGLASVAVDSYTVVQFVTGDTPPAVTTPEVAAVALAARTVVARDGAGLLIAASVTAGVSNAIGFTSVAVDPAVGTGKVSVVRAGTYNPAALVWDASFTTDALKRTAFEPKGVQIFMRKPLF